MSETTNDKNVYRILYCSEISSLLGCSKNTATKIRKDIKEHFGVPIPLMKHFKEYFKV